MESNTFLLYGANGYSGELIARFANQYQLKPIVAGRNAATIKLLAEKYGLESLVFDVNDAVAMDAALSKVKVVVNAAGPFDYTAKQMAEACIRTGVHYLDLNGDSSVFGDLWKYDEQAKKAGVMLLPGAGFDVVPTDCLALQVKNALPNTVDLKIAFYSKGGALSHGTATTTLARLGEPGARRINGVLKPVPMGEHGHWINFSNDPTKPDSENTLDRQFVMSIPWGDIFTAFISTGVPNIETFTGVPPMAFRFLKVQGLFNGLLRSKMVRGMLQKIIDRKPAGPNDEQRINGRMLIWVQATDAAGKTATIRAAIPDGYTTTYHASLLLTQKILNGNFKPGYQTPASAYGADLILEMPDVKRGEVVFA